MTPAELSRTVRHAVCRAVEEGALRVSVPESVSVERPRPGGRGDYATNVALRLAGPAGQQPRAVAEVLRSRIAEVPGIAGIEITGPGFLNITLGEGAQQALVRDVLERGSAYGHGDALRGASIAFGAVDELRAGVWTHTVALLLRSQGAQADVVPGAVDTLHVVPAPAGDLFERLGADAARWGLLAAASHDRPRTGDELLAQHESNPLFRVRYACSRSRALTRGAAQLGFGSDPLQDVDAPALVTAVGDYPVALGAAARHRAPDRLARHLETTADALLAFQSSVLPIGDEKPLAAHRSRLALAEAAGTVLAGGLSLLGISSPEYL
ncbi:DALR anticodon-binding domain-containing protein [Streptomyces sp. NBC_01142]|uniref:ArgS-related anticodon-binding protein NrtL n=1 Tax=Streptomyces sp. NBC_01142 TaxID=2975865 RepID=UPI00224DE683|nr:DALR anticodon-binding domain-containing protein [Streptomyces sp. NBC_01142]MCX4819391.1 DALR anticodon-binding domain-containing protein [Streptomyces sp. NBC_01142]